MEEKFIPQPNNKLNKIEAGAFSDEEKLFMSKNYFISLSEIDNTKYRINDNEKELREEKSKSWLKKDREKIERLEREILSYKNELIIEQNFFKKQEEFLSKHKTEALEGKNEEEILKNLISNAHLIFKVRGTYGGLTDRAVVAGKEAKNFSNYKLNPNVASPKRESDYRREVMVNLFHNKDIYMVEPIEAMPVTYIKETEEGFGIISPRHDFERGGGDGASTFWIVVPKYEKNIQEYLKKHPEMILKVFQTRFSRETCGLGSSEYDDTVNDYANNLVLKSKEFISIDVLNNMQDNCRTT